MNSLQNINFKKEVLYNGQDLLISGYKKRITISQWSIHNKILNKIYSLPILKRKGKHIQLRNSIKLSIRKQVEDFTNQTVSKITEQFLK